MALTIAMTAKAWGITKEQFLSQPVEHQAEMIAVVDIENGMRSVEHYESEFESEINAKLAKSRAR